MCVNDHERWAHYPGGQFDPVYGSPVARFLNLSAEISLTSHISGSWDATIYVSFQIGPTSHCIRFWLEIQKFGPEKNKREIL